MTRPCLVSSLNSLLVALALPFTVDDPTDLTSSLLLAIFESLIHARLPIPHAVRHSRSRDAKARAMLVLLGVLECDVLRGGTASSLSADDSGAGAVSVDGWVDHIGLGDVDPERLADGGVDETIFVGELLCWLARRNGVLPRTKSTHPSAHHRSLYSNHHSYGDTPSQTETSSPSFSVDPNASALSHITDVPRHPLVHSPDPSLSATDLSIRAPTLSSRTSLSNLHDDLDEASQDTVQTYDPLRMMHDAHQDDDHPPTFHPRCIHDLEDPSYIRALAGPSSSSDDDHVPSDDDLDAPPTPTPRRVRLAGWIEPVDAARTPRPDSLPPYTPVSTRRPMRPPSPPSPFDVSFSTLNNTSTPAKPRRQPGARRRVGDGHVGVTPVSARRGSTAAPGASEAGRANTRGSTATTNTLLTERARLLTELAALKRARAGSGAERR